MSEVVDIAIQINPSWRVVVVQGGKWGARAWLLQQSVEGVWCDKAVVRASGMLRSMVQAWCGPVDEGAATTLAALPARSHMRYDTSAVRKRAQAAETRAAAACHLARRLRNQKVITIPTCHRRNDRALQLRQLILRV
jgi:hypothetical protein